MPTSAISLFQKQKHFIANAGWLFADKGVRLVGGLFVGAWVARYLGPHDYGALSYAVAYVSLFSAFCTLGIDRLVIRDVVLTPEHRQDILGTAFFIKFVGGALAQIMAVLSVHLLRQDGHTTLMVAIVSGTALLQAVDVIDFWFQSKVKSKYTVFARNAAFAFFSLVKVALILSEAPVAAFAVSMLGEALLASCLLVLIYHGQGEHPMSWRYRWNIGKKLIAEGWPLLLGFVAYLLYSRIDQIMIGNMLGDKALGVYSAATKISEILVAALLIIGSTVYPRLVDLYEKDKTRFFQWYADITGGMTWAAYLLIAAIVLSGDFLISLLFGPDFSESATVLKYQAIGLLFMFNGSLRSAFLTISGNQRILLRTALVSALISVAFNFLLIPRFGILGSAVTGIVVHACSLYLLNAFTQSTLGIFRIQTQGFLGLPFLLRLRSHLK